MVSLQCGQSQLGAGLAKWYYYFPEMETVRPPLCSDCDLGPGKTGIREGGVLSGSDWPWTTCTGKVTLSTVTAQPLENVWCLYAYESRSANWLVSAKGRRETGVAAEEEERKRT